MRKLMSDQMDKHKVTPKRWLQGVMTFLQKKNARDDLNNYRPITIIDVIYKIWATITPQRLNPILDLPTEDDQYAYKQKRSTIDILSIARNQLKNDTTHQMIIFDFPKAFGYIERDILWAKLYGAGLPIELVQILRIGHEGKTYDRECDGYIIKRYQ